MLGRGAEGVHTVHVSATGQMTDEAAGDSPFLLYSTAPDGTGAPASQLMEMHRPIPEVER